VTLSETESTARALISGERPTLVAVDFSEDSRAALLWAAHLANLTGGRLIVLHVVHDPADQPGYYRRNRENRLQPMERAADEMFDAFLADVRRDHVSLPALERAEKTVVDGLPPTRIVEMASRLDAALIVIGRRGRTRLPQLLQGSVSKRVVQLATVPVVVVKAGKPRAKDG
jgi:nucleotide-binding universal stress UspA family protein